MAGNVSGIDSIGVKMETVAELNERIRKAHPGRELAMAIWSIGRAITTGTPAEENAKRFASTTVREFVATKAAVAGGSVSGSTWGSDLATWTVLARDFVRLQSARTAFGRLVAAGAVRAPWNTRTVTEGGMDAAYARALPIGSLALTAPTALDRLGCGVITVLSGELFRLWSAAAEANILAILARSVRRGVDAAAFDPDNGGGAGEKPAGLLNGISPKGLLLETAANALAAVDSLLGSLVDGGSDLDSAIFVTHPSTCLALSLLQNSNGNQTFPGLGANGGTIFNIPVVATVGAVRSGSPPEKVFACFDASRVLYADDGELQTELSRTTTLQMDDAPTQSALTGTGSTNVSMFQTESVAMKNVRYVNFLLANTSGAAWMTAGF